MRALFQRTREIDWRLFEVASTERVVGELRPAVGAILGEARSLRVFAALDRLRDAGDALDAETVALVTALEGLDPELDALLAIEPSPPARRYAECLRRLSASFVWPGHGSDDGGAPW